MAKKTSKSSKKKKKSWYNIVSPKQFGNKVVGMTPAFEGADMGTRVLQINLNDLTNDHKHQNLKAYLGFSKVQAPNVSTEVVGFEMNPSTLKRVVKKQRSRGDLSKVYETSDKKIRLKFTYVTRKKTSNAVLNTISEKIDEMITPALKKMTYEEVVGAFIARKFQYDLRKTLNKVYPLSFCEIRSLKRM